jgi:hypothetical protein
MLIIGEAINTSRTVQGERRLEAAVIQRDAACIAALACKQRDAGAHYIDANAGTLTAGEPQALAWLTTVIQQAVELPICFDSPNPLALAAALDVYVESRPTNDQLDHRRIHPLCAGASVSARPSGESDCVGHGCRRHARGPGTAPRGSAHTGG